MSNELAGPPTAKWRSLVTVATDDIGKLLKQKKISNELDNDLIERIEKKRSSGVSLYYKFYAMKCVTLILLFLSQYGSEMSVKLFNIEATNISHLKELLLFLAATFFSITAMLEIHNNYCLNILRELMKKEFPPELQRYLSIAYYWEDFSKILVPLPKARISKIIGLMFGFGVFSFVLIVTILLVLEFLIIFSATIEAFATPSTGAMSYVLVLYVLLCYVGCLALYCSICMPLPVHDLNYY